MEYEHTLPTYNFDDWYENGLIHQLGLNVAFENIVDNIYGADKRGNVINIETRIKSSNAIEPPLNGRITVILTFNINININIDGIAVGSCKLQTNFLEGVAKGLYVISPIDWNDLSIYYSQIPDNDEVMMPTVFVFDGGKMVVTLENLKEKSKQQYEMTMVPRGNVTLQELYQRYPILNPFSIDSNSRRVLQDRVRFLSGIYGTDNDFVADFRFWVSYEQSSMIVYQGSRKVANVGWKNKDGRLFYTMVEFDPALGESTYRSTFYSSYEPINAYKQYMKVINQT